MRLLMGGGIHSIVDDKVEEIASWSTVVAGEWLGKVLDKLRKPVEIQEKVVEEIIEKHLKATLRPYQRVGVEWLWLLYQLKLGGCLADDMGLGKTIQVLSLLLLIKDYVKGIKKPHLLVLPASLIGNWLTEARKFAPSLIFF